MPAKKKQSEKVDKRYRAKITIPGVDKPIYVSARTRAELEEKKASVRRQYITGEQDQRITFHALVREWWEKDKLPRFRSESTMLVYRSLINNYVFPFFPSQKLARAVSFQELQSCVDQMEGSAHSQAVHLRTTLKSIVQYGVACRYLSADIAAGLKLPAAKETAEKDFLTDDQTRRLLQAASTEEYGIIIYLLYYLGLRRGEMLALRWGDIDWTTNMVHVQRSVVVNSKIADGKTRAANRYVPVPSPLRRVLFPIRGLPTEYIVQNPSSVHEGHLMSSGSLLWHWHLMMYRAGLARLSDDFIRKNEARVAAGKPPLAVKNKDQVIPEVTPHWLRHNYVSILYDAGVDPVTATRIVGHTSYQTTADIYTHISEMRKRQASLNIDHVFNKVAERLPAYGNSPFL